MRGRPSPEAVQALLEADESYRRAVRDHERARRQAEEAEALQKSIREHTRAWRQRNEEI